MSFCKQLQEQHLCFSVPTRPARNTRARLRAQLSLRPAKKGQATPEAHEKRRGPAAKLQHGAPSQTPMQRVEQIPPLCLNPTSTGNESHHCIATRQPGEAPGSGALGAEPFPAAPLPRLPLTHASCFPKALCTRDKTLLL